MEGQGGGSKGAHRAVGRPNSRERFWGQAVGTGQFSPRVGCWDRSAKSGEVTGTGQPQVLFLGGPGRGRWEVQVCSHYLQLVQCRRDDPHDCNSAAAGLLELILSPHAPLRTGGPSLCSWFSADGMTPVAAAASATLPTCMTCQTACSFFPGCAQFSFNGSMVTSPSNASACGVPSKC